jgi:hypothetical protein
MLRRYRMKNLRSIYPKLRTEAPTMGLGDLVAKVAQPIAKAIDAVAGTNLKNCPGCARRRQALNDLVPAIGRTPPTANK